MRVLVFILAALCLSITAVGQNISLTPKEEKFVKSLIGRMTLEEKCSMLHGNSKFNVGGISRLGIPEWALSDGPHGVRAEINRHNWNYTGQTDDFATYMPTGTALAATWNPVLSYERGLVLGEEARARGKDVLLGPGVNIIRTPLGGRNFEYLSEDPYLNARMAVPYIKGLQSKDVAASVKHFIANNQETDRGTVDVYMSDRALHEIYLPAFKAAVEEGQSYTVMCAYNKFRGDWCSENEFLGRQILRKEFKFNGVFMSDWAAVHSTAKAANAGLDLEMGSDIDDYSKWYFANPLVEAVKRGAVSISTINEKVENILRVMVKTKIFDSKNRCKGSMNTPDHQRVAYQTAAEALVLLKNQGDVLPLDASKIKSVAVIGDNAMRTHASAGQSSEIKALYEVSPFEAISKKYGEKITINYALGYERQTKSNYEVVKGTVNYNKVDWKLIDEAVEQAKRSDVALIFCGLNHDFDTESTDKPDMRLPYGQVTLIQEVAKVNPHTVVVVVAGSPVELAPVNYRVPAIMWSWFNGMEGGNAVIDAIFGGVNPSGKMPFTLPVTLEQSPVHALGNFPGRDLKENYEEDILVGYRWFDTKHVEPLYPFGFGLSYTQFDVAKPSVNKNTFTKDDFVKISFTVTNKGSRAGAEVLQLYFGQPNASVFRPAKELKAFQKVFLHDGESKTVEMNVKVSDLAFYDERTSAWVVESGRFVMYVGTSSQNILYQDSIEVR